MIEFREAEYGDFDIGVVVEIAHAIRPDTLDTIAGYVALHDAERSAGRVCVRWLASIERTCSGSASTHPGRRRQTG